MTERTGGTTTLSFSTEEFIARWEDFFDEAGYGPRVTALADAYPEERSLAVAYGEVDRFDTDLALHLLEHPQNALFTAERALQRFVPPTEEAPLRFRVRGLPRDLRIEVRDLRAKHLGKYVSVEGLVRKATEVRPRLVEAVFQCLRCGAVIKEAQEGLNYREPLECYEDQGGCTRAASATKWKLLDEGSRYVDTQKIEVQEPPEELRGGEAPQRLAAYLEEDLVGFVNPGDRVVLNGVLRGSQRGRFSTKSTLFDIFVDANSFEREQVEYEEIEITREDKERIQGEASSGDVIRKIVGSIAPSIYGMTVEKEALGLQLFGGVTKQLPDGRRIRGDTHILLVGDPGTGKSELLTYMTKLSPRGIFASGKAATAAGLCVTGDTLVHTPQGLREIRDIVSQHLPDPTSRETCYEHAETVYTLREGRVALGKTSLAWRMPRKPCCKLVTSYGKAIEASENTKFLTCGDEGLEWKRIKDLRVGDFVAAPEYSLTLRCEPSVHDFIEYENECLKLSRDSLDLLRSKLRNKHGSLRVAARTLGLSESFIYTTLQSRFIPFPKLSRILDDLGLRMTEVEVKEVMLRYGDRLRLPASFDGDLMYLIGVVFGDGDIHLSKELGLVRVSNSNLALLRRVQDIMEEKFGRRVRIESQRDRVPCLRLHSKTIARFFRNVGMRTPKDGLRLHPGLTTSPHVDSFVRGLMDADGSVVWRKGKEGSDSVQFSTISRRLAQQVQLLLETYGIKAGLRRRRRKQPTRLQNGRQITPRHDQYHLIITGKHIDAFADGIGFSHPRKARVLGNITDGHTHTNRDFLPLAGLLGQSAAPSSGHWVYFRARRNPSRWKAAQILTEVAMESDLRRQATEVFMTRVTWEQVKRVEPSGVKEVFDLTVPNSHNFVANGLIVHNTAAAVRDEFGEGRWTLEAGALVLADLGHCMIDEIEKMSEQDRSAIHTAMEQQTVHIAKAGITATLQTRCSILAAANPDLGRFDENKYISDQISLPSTLLSRFDCIFPVMDKPQAQHDQAMAEHILKGHLVGEILRQAEGHQTVAELEGVDDPFRPYFEPAFLRKYVAYARRLTPIMSDEAMQILQDKYLEIRKQGEGDGRTVPITPRQLEGFIRLAEASARARLSPRVEREDADRSVRIIEYWLKKVTGLEGGFDIDIVATGISGSQRAQMVALREIIAELSERDGAAELRDIQEMAEERGIPPSRVEAWLRRWSQEGEVYSPAANKWKLVTRY